MLSADLAEADSTHRAVSPSIMYGIHITSGVFHLAAVRARLHASLANFKATDILRSQFS